MKTKEKRPFSQRVRIGTLAAVVVVLAIFAGLLLINHFERKELDWAELSAAINSGNPAQLEELLNNSNTITGTVSKFRTGAGLSPNQAVIINEDYPEFYFTVYMKNSEMVVLSVGDTITMKGRFVSADFDTPPSYGIITGYGMYDCGKLLAINGEDF